MFKTKYNKCPACGTPVAEPNSIDENMRVVETFRTVLGFVFQCYRCKHNWYEPITEDE